MVSSESTSTVASHSGKGWFTESVRNAILLGLLLFIATVALYSPVRNHPFMVLDDPKYVTQNPHIQGGLNLAVVGWALTHGYAANWHPLTWMSHAADIGFFGLDPEPQHLENVLLHAVNALLLFWVLWKATGYMGRSWMVAALFALHPINVESVAWIAERKTMLSTLFFLLALAAYRWYARQPGFGRYVMVAFLFVLGLMGKPQIITLPFVLLLWDYWPLHRMFAGDTESLEGTATTEVVPARSFSWLVKEKLPLFGICLVDAAVTMIAQHVGPPKSWGYSLSIRIGNAIVSYARYVGKAFWPTNLSLYYVHPGNSLRWWQVGGAFLLLLAITALALARRRQRYLLVGWLWFLGTLVPMIGLIQVDMQGMADRYAYVSFIGLFLMFCWGVADWSEQWHLPRAVLPVVSAAVLVFLSAVSHRQVSYWSDEVTLWTHCTEVTNNNLKAEFYLGFALLSADLPDEAAQHFRKAESYNRGDPDTNLQLAFYEHKRGNLPQAIEYYKTVLAITENPALKRQVLTNMAAAYRAMGDYSAANECLQNAAQAAPAYSIDWQGEWWKNIIPMIRQYFHGGASKPSKQL